MNTTQAVQGFWAKPEDVVAEMLRGELTRGASIRQTCQALVEASQTMYPDKPFSKHTVTGWLDWARQVEARSKRRPNLENGVKLFKLLLARLPK